MRKFYLGILMIGWAGFLFGQDLYDINKIREVRVTFQQDDWAAILDNFKEAGNNERLLGTVTIDGVRYDSVGVRHKGNSSYFNVRKTGSSKLPFNIKASYKKKKQRFPGGYESLKLSNVFRDPSFLREVMAYDIAKKYMPSPRANFIKLYINNEYLGLYNNTESVDEKFLKEHFGSDEGALIKCDPNWHGTTRPGCKKGENGSLNYLGPNPNCYFDYYEKKSDSGWRDLVELTRVLQEDVKNIEQVLNVDRALWMLAYNNVLVNLDSYSGRLCHNYYVYKDGSGRFNTIPWDMNLNFGGFRFVNSKSVLDTEGMQRLSPLSNFKNPMRPLISQLLQNSLYRKVYLAHIRTILKENFSNGAYVQRAKEIQKVIDAAVQGDDNKLYTYEDFQNNLTQTTSAGRSKIVGLTELMEPRVAYLEAHPLLQKTPPQISNVEHQKNEETNIVTAKLKGVRKAFVFYKAPGADVFERAPMKDDGTAYDEYENDGIFGAVVPSSPGMQYYILALNEDAAMLSPERAAYEFYTVD